MPIAANGQPGRHARAELDGQQHLRNVQWKREVRRDLEMRLDGFRELVVFAKYLLEFHSVVQSAVFFVLIHFMLSFVCFGCGRAVGVLLYCVAAVSLLDWFVVALRESVRQHANGASAATATATAAAARPAGPRLAEGAGGLQSRVTSAWFSSISAAAGLASATLRRAATTAGHAAEGGGAAAAAAAAGAGVDGDGDDGFDARGVSCSGDSVNAHTARTFRALCTSAASAAFAGRQLAEALAAKRNEAPVRFHAAAAATCLLSALTWARIPGATLVYLALMTALLVPVTARHQLHRKALRWAQEHGEVALVAAKQYVQELRGAAPAQGGAGAAAAAGATRAGAKTD